MVQVLKSQVQLSSLWAHQNLSKLLYNHTQTFAFASQSKVRHWKCNYFSIEIQANHENIGELIIQGAIFWT